MAERLPQVEKMIDQVMKKKELSQAAAIEYMLAVATGRLAALWRYDKTLPEGKPNKGILAVAGRKKRAERSKAINAPRPERAAAKEVKAPAPKRKRKPKKSNADHMAERAAKLEGTS